MQANSDESLIARIAQGDRLAMKVLYGRHHVRVYRFALRLTPGTPVAPSGQTTPSRETTLVELGRFCGS